MTQNDMDDYFTRTIVGEELEQDATYTMGKTDSPSSVRENFSPQQQNKVAEAVPFDSSLKNTDAAHDKQDGQVNSDLSSISKTVNVDQIPDSLDFSSLDAFSLRRTQELEKTPTPKHLTRARLEPALNPIERSQTSRRLGAAVQTPIEQSAAVNAPQVDSNFDFTTQANAATPLTKITLPTQTKSGFMGKSIRMETLVFAVLGVIVSFVLLIAAYSLWLQ